MPADNPTPYDHIRWIVNTSIEDGKQSIQSLLRDREKHTDPALLDIFEKAMAMEIHGNHRKSLIVALRSAIKQVTPMPTNEPTGTRYNHETGLVELTTEAPRDPAWDQVRETSDQLRACGRLFLRGQVKLGMMLAALKKEHCQHGGKVLPWADLVKQETGYSRQSCDEFIRLAEACKAKIRTAKTLNLPAPVKQDAIALFRSENPLTLSDDQWALVDQVIGSLTTGETQASLLQELGIIPKPKPMPKGTKETRKDGDEPTAGQLAFHFFEAMTSPLINARTNPDYKKLLYALPLHSTQDHPLSLATLESEARAMLADIEDAKQAAAKPARGKTITV